MELGEEHTISAVGHIRPVWAVGVAGSSIGMRGRVCFASTSRASTHRGGGSIVAARDSFLSFVDEVAHDGLYFVKDLVYRKNISLKARRVK